MTSIIYVGMDVYTRTFSLCPFDKEKCEPSMEVGTLPEAKKVQEVLEALRVSLTAESNDKIEFVCCYEARCLGYSLYHQM